MNNEPSFKKSPVTLEEVFQDLERKGEDKNFLEREAVKAGVDFDDKRSIEPEGYPDKFISEAEQATNEE